MYSGISPFLIALLACSFDGAPLVNDDDKTTRPVMYGALRCSACARHYPVRAGIVHMLSEDELDPESEHERRLREENEELERAHGAYRSFYRMREVRQTLEGLRLHANSVVLELGCGTGRYTSVLTRRDTTVLAVDFSLKALETLSRSYSGAGSLGLVHADVARFRLAQRRFTHCLSTLVSNLPSAEHRRAMYRLTSSSLRDDGRFVFGTHHHDLRRWWRGMPQAGRYSTGGIYCYHFRREELLTELSPFFHRVSVRPINAVLPRILGCAPPEQLGCVAERIPGFAQLGRLLLVEAVQPIRLGQCRVQDIPI